MDNYKLYANLIRKPDSTDFNARPCEVEKWIPISHMRIKNNIILISVHTHKV